MQNEILGYCLIYGMFIIPATFKVISHFTHSLKISFTIIIMPFTALVMMTLSPTECIEIRGQRIDIDG
jgi:hypothetical protein